MKTKEISTKEYAKLYGSSPQNITKLLRNNKSLPHVVSVRKIARDYIFEVPVKIESYFKNQL